MTRARLVALLARRRDYAQEVRDLCAERPRVVFYGCGAILASIVDTWREQVGLRIDYVCDSDPAKWGQTFCGALCLSPDELLSIRSSCTVFVTVGQFQPVYHWLMSSGFPSVHLLYKYDLESCAKLRQQDPEEVADELCRAREVLEDNRSRLVFDIIINRVLGEAHFGVMDPVCVPDQYFPSDIIQLTDHEVFVDVGAYDGDTLREFVEQTEGSFKQAHAFELDAENFRVLKQNVEAMPEADRIRLYNLGAWQCDCEVTYSHGRSQSTLGAGDGRGRVVALDGVLRNTPVSFIKMDIEGAEPNALYGAANLIRTHKPKLAICVYHAFAHLWSIPLYLKELVPEYRIYLRHHTPLEYETVCYAVAEEGA